MTSTKLGVVLAGLIASQALGASTISYTLELGGNNNTASWKTPVGCNPAFFSSGSTADGVTYSGNITWAARVAVSGTQTDTGLAPAGVANAVFNLELHAGTDTSPASLVGTFGLGSASTKGFFSTINDGTARGGGCGFPADPTEASAFPVAFSVDGVNHGRVVDNDTAGGPGFDYYQYPSTLSFPPTSTAVSGTLMGMGAGYSSFNPGGCPTDCGFYPGHATAGVGYQAASGNVNCATALGVGPVGEGQLNLTGLASGVYTLVLVPGTGNNVLNGNFACTSVNPGAFALAPNNPTLGDTITFNYTSGGGGCTRTVASTGLFYNNSAWDGNTAAYSAGDSASVDPTKAGLLPGGTATAANYSNYQRGINGIVVDLTPGGGCLPLSGAMTAGDIAATFAFSQATPAAGATPTVGSFTAIATAVTSVNLVAGGGGGSVDRAYIVLPDNFSGNTNWLRVVVKSNANGGKLDLAADKVFYLGWAKGKATAPSGGVAAVGSGDVNQIKLNPKAAGVALLTDTNDNNKDKAVGTADVNNALLNPTSSTTGLKMILAP